MFGKRLSDYVRLQGVILALVALAFGLRLLLEARWASVTWVLLVGSLYYGYAVHAGSFGSYKQLYALNLIQGAFANTLVAAAIVSFALTGRQNLFSAPEFTQPPTISPWTHAAAHFFVAGLIVVPLAGWALSSLVLFVTRKASGGTPATS